MVSALSLSGRFSTTFATAPSIVKSTDIPRQPYSGSGADRVLGFVGREARGLRTTLRVAFTLANRRAPISASTAGSKTAASVCCVGVPLCWSRLALVRRLARASSDISGSLVNKSISFLLASGPPAPENATPVDAVENTVCTLGKTEPALTYIGGACGTNQQDGGRG